MRGKPYLIKPAEAFVWAQQFETAKRYLSKINAKKEVRAQYLYTYCDWAEKNPDALLQLKFNSDPNHFDDAENLLDRFVTDYDKMPESMVRGVSIVVRGFYSRNRRRLEKAGEVEYSPKKAQKKPSKQERFKLFQACYNPRDKVAITLPNCSAIALETLSHLRWDMFEHDWMQQDIPHISIDSEFLKGHGKGKYRGVRQETFCTPECKRLLIDYRGWYTKTFRYIWQDDDHVLLDVKDKIGGPLSYGGLANMIRIIAERAGVSFGIHDGRRVLNTALQDVECDPNWIQMAMGRKVPGNKNPYTKPNIEQLRSKFKKALPELEFLGVGFKNDSFADWTPEERQKLKKIVEWFEAGELVHKPKNSL